MEQFKEFMMKAWEFLNAPLPIVGVSLIFILIFLWKIISSSSFGKKNIKRLNEVSRETKESVDKKLIEYDTKIKEQDEKIEQQNKEIEYLKQFIVRLCLTSPNKKIKELAKELDNGEESIDNSSKEE